MLSVPSDHSGPASALLLVRADANAMTGIGHLVRGVALAQAWRRVGGHAKILTRSAVPLTVIGGGELEHEVLSGPLASEVDRIVSIARGTATVWIACDGYGFDIGYVRTLRDRGLRVVQVDDDLHAPRYEPDILLDQNLCAIDRGYRVAPWTRTLFGPRYALVREGFLADHEARRAARLTVLVILGGTDPKRQSARIVRAIRPRLPVSIRMDVVLGPDASAGLVAEVSRAADEVTGHAPVVLHRQPDVPALMRSADIAIAASGSTSWELCALGVPMILLSVAEHQVGIGRSLADACAAVYVGRHDEVSDDSIRAAFLKVAGDPELRARMRHAARRLVDGQGGARVVATMLQRPLALQ